METERVKSRRRPALTVSRMVEDVVGCKWSLAVLAAVGQGVRRPGAIQRSLPGLTTKVLNERLRKLVRFGILARKAYPETPPRVEYELTPFGARFGEILERIASLEEELRRSSRRNDPTPGPARQ